MAYRGLAKPEEAWYSGRAGGRVGAHDGLTLRRRRRPLPFILDPPTAANEFLERIREILHELAPAVAQDQELTDAMRRVRAAGFEQRRAVYKRDRVQNQITWYTDKADTHSRAATTWLRVSVLASAAGVVVATLRVFGVVDLDLLGVAGAVASAAIAWNQLNRTNWATFVSDAEDAVSREHTMWLACHGHPGIRLQ